MTGKGSIILKIVIVLLAVGLWQVITIPDNIWSEENRLESTSRANMNAIYEAQQYYYSKNKRFVPADSLERLITFIESDSALNQRQKIGRLTHVLNDSISRILDVPTIEAVIPISSSLREITGDLEFNTRYFEKYDNIMSQKEEIAGSIKKFIGSTEYPNFVRLRNYTDSLSTLADRINEYKLQRAAQMSQRFVDSIVVYLPNIELDAVQSYWSQQYTQINGFVQDIKQTDITQVSSVGDRLKKFIDRINSAMGELEKLNRQQDVNTLQRYKSGIGIVYNRFLEPDNFLTTQNNAIMQLNEIDSILVKLKPEDFYDPDDIDGTDKYLVAFKPGVANLVVESPNLLDGFQSDLQTAAAPIKNMAFLGYVDKLHAVMDSTAKKMDDAKTEYRLSRYSTDILLGIKEVSAEMKDLNNVKFYRYVNNVKKFVDQVDTEKRLSIMKPLIEDILNPIDTLASRIKEKDVHDLSARLDYFNNKIGQIDSMIANNNRIPSRVKRDITNFQSTFQGAYKVVDDMTASFNAQEADQMVAAAKQIEAALLKTLNGYDEKVYYVFTKTHKNHGFIENGQKSWEAE